MVCHTILKMERMASALSRRICRRSVWKQEYGPRSGENRAIDSGNEAVLPGGQLWNGSRTFTAQRRQVVEQMIKWRAELEGSRLAQRMTGRDLRPRPRKHTVTQLRCWEKGGDSAGNYPWKCFSHTIQSKQVKTGIARGTCANHHPCLVVYWFCCIRHLISFRLTHIYRCSFKNLLTKSRTSALSSNRD